MLSPSWNGVLTIVLIVNVLHLGNVQNVLELVKKGPTWILLGQWHCTMHCIIDNALAGIHLVNAFAGECDFCLILSYCDLRWPQRSNPICPWHWVSKVIPTEHSWTFLKYSILITDKQTYIKTKVYYIYAIKDKQSNNSLQKLCTW